MKGSHLEHTLEKQSAADAMQATSGHWAGELRTNNVIAALDRYLNLRGFVRNAQEVGGEQSFDWDLFQLEGVACVKIFGKLGVTGSLELIRYIQYKRDRSRRIVIVDGDAAKLIVPEATGDRDSILLSVPGSSVLLEKDVYILHEDALWMPGAEFQGQRRLWRIIPPAVLRLQPGTF